MKKVLIADDSMIASRQLAKIVQEIPGFSVVGRAANGAEALALCVELAPDIVCMDMIMPVLDGLQALRTLTAPPRTLQVVMVSSLGVLGDRAAEAIRLGASAVIAKPFVPEQVHEVLAGL